MDKTNKRWRLKISLKDSLGWDIIEEYKTLTSCIKDASDLKDSSVKSIIIEDKVTGKSTFI